ncbi:MAG: sigma-54-dependent Fis family transcriptional regulator [Phycisphaerae bacterium]|nr:sigma-54-dependent Fis family transcriptional regulator [Phycisphaerae bacterium]
MNNDATILIVDDEKEHADVLVEALEKQCGRAFAVYTADDAMDVIEQEKLDLIITDLNLRDDINGIDILRAAREHDRNVRVILITAYATIDTCKEAIKSGAYDYLVKPIDVDQLRGMVAKALPARKPAMASGKNFVFEGVLSRSPAMQPVFRVLRRVAPTTISVLIQGESGTGKELTARAIHTNSPRRGKPFRPLNCAGLTESLLESELFGHAKGAFTGASTDRKGLFEMADGGTLFLDEIGDMPLSMQAKLLRVLEDGIVTPVGSNKSTVVDVRVVSATNHDLVQLVEDKKFRQDLFFRIKGVSVTLPPLRSRPEDIPELFGYFLREACEETGADIHLITEQAMKVLVSYNWPGNIRQLRNAVRTMLVMCEGDTLDVRDIPADIHHIRRLSGAVAAAETQEDELPVEAMAGKSLNEVEREHIRRTLEFTNNNRAEAAKILEIGERTLYRKIKEYNL